MCGWIGVEMVCGGGQTINSTTGDGFTYDVPAVSLYCMSGVHVILDGDVTNLSNDVTLSKAHDGPAHGDFQSLGLHQLYDY